MSVEDKPIIIMGDAFSIDSLAEIVANEVFWDGVSVVHLNVDRRATLLIHEDGDILPLTDRDVIHLAPTLASPMKKSKRGWMIRTSVTKTFARKVLVLLNAWGRSQSGRASSTIAIRAIM